MAENKSNISLLDVYTQFDGSTEQVYKVEFNVQDTGGTNIQTLTEGNFSLSGDPANWNAAFDTATSQGKYSFTTTAFVPDDSHYLYAQVTTSTERSDKFFLDFYEAYSSSEATYSFVMPSETGDYKIELDTVNDQDTFTVVKSAQIRGVEDITTAGSKVLIKKSYLTHFVGETLSTYVTIGNADSATLEVSMVANKQ